MAVQDHVKREKDLQAECSSCHIVRLVASYKDTSYLYMLLDCIMGGELFTYMQVSPGSHQNIDWPHKHVRLVHRV